MVMCYHLMGYAVLFSATDLIHRSVMQSILTKTEISILKISTADIIHHPETFLRLNNDEIFYNGSYYDVKNETSDTQFTFFHVTKDVGENDWHHQLSEAGTYSDTNNADGKTLKSNAKIFSPEWVSNFSFQYVFRNSVQFFLTFCNKNNSNFNGDIFIPPPQV